MSFRNLTPQYQSALDAAQTGQHIMQIGLNTNATGNGYHDSTMGSPINYNYVEYIANQEGTDIQAPANAADALQTAGQYHKRYFPNVKYWSSFTNTSWNDTTSQGFDIEVIARSIIGHNFGYGGGYSPTAVPSLYFELFAADTIYGKFDRIAIWEPLYDDMRSVLVLTVGEYN